MRANTTKAERIEYSPEVMLAHQLKRPPRLSTNYVSQLKERALDTAIKQLKENLFLSRKEQENEPSAH